MSLHLGTLLIRPTVITATSGACELSVEWVLPISRVGGFVGICDAFAPWNPPSAVLTPRRLEPGGCNDDQTPIASEDFDLEVPQGDLAERKRISWMNKALFDADMYSEVRKALNPSIARSAATYRQTHGVLTVSVITMLEAGGLSVGLTAAGATAAEAVDRLAEQVRMVA